MERVRHIDDVMAWKQNYRVLLTSEHGKEPRYCIELIERQQVSTSSLANTENIHPPAVGIQCRPNEQTTPDHEMTPTGRIWQGTLQWAW